MMPPTMRVYSRRSTSWRCERRIRAPVADAIRLIALTGCRRGEAAGLRWSHVDLQHGRLVLPPTAHKTGRKTGKPRTIILPSTAQAIIARQPEGDAQDFVFAPARGDNALALSKAWRKVRAEANLPADIGLHGLRHSVASHMAMARRASARDHAGGRAPATSARYAIHPLRANRTSRACRARSGCPACGHGRPQSGGKVEKLRGRK